MSPNVGNFVHDLVEMAKAMEALPMVQAQLDRANDQVEAYAKQVQRLELKLIDRATEITTLGLTLAGVEAERDDAELRFLESVDRTASALAFIKSTFGSAGSLIQALEPPTPTAVVVPIASEPTVTDTALPVHHGDLEADAKDYHASTQADAPQGQSERDPTSSVSEQAATAETPTVSPLGTAPEAISVSSDPAPVSASPTVSASDTEHSVPTTVGEASPTDGGATDTDPAPTDRGPYHGRKWTEVSPAVNGIGDWVDGGGARDDYWL